jgi:hypothetical protein
MSQPKTASLELKFYPDDADPAEIRQFVESHYGRVLPDNDLLYRVALAAHEFLENAVKYSSDGAARFIIEVEGDSNPKISISLWNRAGAQHRQELQQIFAEMDSFTNAFEHYNQLLRTRRKRTTTLSAGVGLARLRAEGEMRLTLICEDDRVCLRAEADMTTPSGDETVPQRVA